MRGDECRVGHWQVPFRGMPAGVFTHATASRRRILGEERGESLVDGFGGGEVVDGQGLTVELLEGDAGSQVPRGAVEGLQLENRAW